MACPLLNNKIYHYNIIAISKKWCGWRDLNPHERTLTTPSRWRVCHSTTTAWNTNGASGQNRTVDTRIFSPLLYQLSYRGKIFCKKKWRPRSDLNWRSSPWQGDMLTATPRGRVSTLVDYLYIIPWILDQCNYFFELFLWIYYENCNNKLNITS